MTCVKKVTGIVRQARRQERQGKYLTGPLAGGARRGCCGAEAAMMYGEAGTG